MDQVSAGAYPPLGPPERDVARQYLAYAEAIVERRDRLVDRRPVAWLRILGGVGFSASLCIAALAVRDSAPSLRWQALLILALLWGELARGFMQDSDRGVHPAPLRRLATAAGIGLVLAGLGTLLLVIVNERISPLWLLVPAVAVLLGFGGFGLVELLRAPRPTRQEPRRLSTSAQWGTMLVGLVVAAVTWLGTVPADPTSGMLLLLVMMVFLLGWIVASTTALGLTAIGAAWRWPHITVFVIATIAAGVLIALSADRSASAWVAGGVVAMFGGAVFVPGRSHG